MDMDQIAAVFSEKLGKEIRYQKLPMFITRLVMGKDLYKMFSWVNKNKEVILEEIKSKTEEITDLLDLPEWIKLKF